MKKITVFALGCFMLLGSAIAADPATKSIESINKDKDALVGKQVTFQGKVVKVNNGIMQRNFIHVQDEKASGDTNKLIATSNQTAAVNQNVKVTGKVTLNRDFGMGYSYPLLIEEATVTPAQ